LKIHIKSIKDTNLQTRVFKFGFDSLRIYYIDKEELNDMVDLRISDKNDWLTILSKIEKKTKYNTV
ncbi:hypothetical protein, partial [Mangrovimonas sp. TPBH4]|uniref:hypothetical protein n=1 Tax=Mangrovimonas sp. TPBH4 TaxID=1645914 RepID=UPI000AA96FB4